MQDYAQAFAFVAALTQSDPASTPVDLRMIHDVRKDIAAIPRRGTLPELWNEICAWNNQGYGAFININHMDGNGHEIANVAAIRCQAIDLDNLSANQNYERAIAFNPAPAFAVQSSPGKFHVYWSTKYHTNRDGFTLLQRKLRTLFDGDKTVIDPSRVLRLPGMFHLKNPATPHLVKCWQLPGFGNPIDAAYLEVALAGVNIVDGGGDRHELGSPSLAAPGLDWCIRALIECDPNALDRGEWISFTSAYKQAAWNFAPEAKLLDLWLKWCERYQLNTGNNVAENLKNWNSIRNTQVGWQYIERRNANLHALRLYGDKQAEYQQAMQGISQPQPQPLSSGVPTQTLPPTGAPIPKNEKMLDAVAQKEWFKGCVLIIRAGEILTPDSRYLNASQFNAAYGSKKFVIDEFGKQTNEAWQAATRSTEWTIPKVDHIRFVPSEPHGAIILDSLGRKGVNTYVPAQLNLMEGDVSPFLRHMELLFPSPIDRKILYDYLAHNAKYPGFKIPWAPLIQSTEGAGKNAIKYIMTEAMGKAYTYEPSAKQLVESGSKFNAWMRARLFILVDEIRTDERRDMIEVLKPMISEETIEVQAKGVDQDLEDNFSNWMFFSNFKDAIPINQNARRFAVFYSAVQSQADLLARGMDGQYFNNFYNKWLLASNGRRHVAHWLHNYPIERGDIPMRAPMTTSTLEAIRQSRGPVETLIYDAVEDQSEGFRGGWISTLAVHKGIKANGIRAVSGKTLATILETMGYHFVARSPRAYIKEGPTRSDLFNVDRHANPELFGNAQGYAPVG